MTAKPTPAGRQCVLPGAGPDIAGMLQKRASDRLRPTKPQAPCDVGLFSDDARQTDLVDLTRGGREA